MSNTIASARSRTPSRRQVLRSAAAVAGAAIGSGAVRGFPTLWAQNLKDITLIHIGTSTAVIKEIGDRARKDLGFNVVMQPTDTATQLQRTLTQPRSFDILEIDNSYIKYIERAGVLKPIAVKDYKWWDQTLPMFTTGKFPNGKPIPDLDSHQSRSATGLGLTAKNLPTNPPIG